MNEIQIPFSHDGFIKFVLKQEIEARSFLRGVLPEKHSRNIDFSTVELTTESYVDETIRQSFSDLVYKAESNDKEKVKLLLIIEHKSQPTGAKAAFQLLSYFVLAASIELTKKTAERRIPLMHLVCNGKQGCKTKPLWKLFGNVPKKYRSGIPHFKYSLSDFSIYSDDKIIHLFDSFKIRAMVRVMRDVKNKVEILKSLDIAISELLEYKDDISREKFINALFNFVVSTADIEIEDIEKTINKHSIKNIDTMTLAEKLITKGEQQGMQQGMHKGGLLDKYEIALRMIRKEHSDAIIEDLTSLSLSQIKILRNLYTKYGNKSFDHIENLIEEQMKNRN